MTTYNSSRVDYDDSSSNISDMSRTSDETISSTSTAPPSVVDPTCVVGMACRVPGATTPSKLWENIANKVDLQRKVPSDRFNVDAWYHSDGSHKGTTNARYGYFLDQDLGLFDASFFKISGREAEAMDPQQRLLLEVVYEALENAGITLEEIRGTQTSVFCGTFTNDYHMATAKDLVNYPKYAITGTGNSILSNRISYFYDLHGPSATIDTACSSSLVGFHLGSQSLQNGEADFSIVVGSALHFDPTIYVEMTDLGMLSTDGRCRHGDAKGSGYARGDGITAVVLRRKQCASSSGNKIRAVIRGTGVNHDGRKQGITLPSPAAQADLMRRVYASAGLDPLETDFVECHGTGTKAGDPRELGAISEVFSPGRETPLWVGSVKSNIGHLEGASGLAGVMKAVMALEKNQIPPNMLFETPNPQVDFRQWKLRIPTEVIPWKSATARRVSLNSFGYGGTNAHIILEEYSAPEPSHDVVGLPPKYADLAQNRPYLLPLTSHSERAGKIMASKFCDYLRGHPNVSLVDFATTLGTNRSMHAFRSFVVGSDASSMMDYIADPPPVAKWKQILDSPPRLGFVFTGQGAQWFAMGRQLIEQSPLFRQSLEKMDSILRSLPDAPTWSIVEELTRSQDESRLDDTAYSQPLCTALQLAIVDLLTQWGIRPTAVVGHSSGEMAAAYAAGLLSFENAIVAAYYRGLYMGVGAQSPKGVKGAMMAVGLSETETRTELEPYVGRLAVAAMNSPSSFTISGDEDAIVELQKTLADRKIFHKRLQVGQAFHSHHMLPLAPAYEQALENHPGFSTQPPTALMASSVTARKANPDTMGPAYFTANMTSTVKFSDALTGIVLDDEDNQNVDVLVEIGPRPVLRGPTKQTLDYLKLDVPYLGSLDHKTPAFEALLNCAGQLFGFGYPVDLVAVNQNMFYDDRGYVTTPGYPQRLEDLPTYGWDHERYWAETRVYKDTRLRKCNHEILGAPIPGSMEHRPRFRNFLRMSEMPWLADHTIAGQAIFPAAGYINMAIEAAAFLNSGKGPIREFNLKDISIKSALVVSDSDLGNEILLELTPVADSAKTTSSTWYEFGIFSFDESEQSREHCTGLISVETGTPAPIRRVEAYQSSAEIRRKSNRCMTAEKYYTKLNAVGLQYGPSFQLMSSGVESGPGFATAEISWKPELFSREVNARSIVHPAFLDACIHPLFAAIESRLTSNLTSAFVPTFIRSLRVSGILERLKADDKGYTFNCSANTTLKASRVAVNDVRIESKDDDQLLLDAQGLELTSIGSDSDDSDKRTLFFGTRWNPVFDRVDAFGGKVRFDSIEKAIDIFAHQFPNTKILHYTTSAATTRKVLSHLGGVKGQRRRFGRLVIRPEGEESPEFKSLVDEYEGLVAMWTQSEEQFDAVVVSAPTRDDVQQRLSTGGFIFTSDPKVRYEGMKVLSRSANLTVWSTLTAKPEWTQPLTIVMPDADSDRASAVAGKIEKNYPAMTTRISFTELADVGDFSGNYVVLANLGSDLFFDAAGASRAEFEAARALLVSQSCNIVWVTQGGLMDSNKPEQGLVLGLSRSARSENDRLRLVVFDIAESSDLTRTAEWTLQLLDPLVGEDELAERDGIVYAPRVEADDSLNAKIPNGVNHENTLQSLYQDNRHLSLRIERPGFLDSFCFEDESGLFSLPLGVDELEIEVEASAVSYRDVAIATGSFDDYRMGGECAGAVVRKGSAVTDNEFMVGDRVVALRPGQGTHQTLCRNPASLCFKLNDMPSARAASLPLDLATAYYSLVDVARLREEETVLIHAAAGGAGQMALQIARTIGAKIVATVDSVQKKELLQTTYGLPGERILLSDHTFVDGLMKLTGGLGVDVVLNSLTGSLLHATWRCVAPFGRFVEIGKRDIIKNAKIDMDPFGNNITFSSVDMVTMYEKNKPLAARVLKESFQLVCDGKVLPPSTINNFSYAEVHKAFRLVQGGKSDGKVVLVPGKSDLVMVKPPTFNTGPLFKPDKTYLLVGGLGGVGRSLAEWLLRRGARKLAFLSRSADKRDTARETIEWLRAHEVKVTLFKADVADIDAVKSCIDQLGDNLAGVFQAAMVLQDTPLDKMNYRQWQTTLLPKVRGGYNLHMATLNSKLDFFVCFSSVSAVQGTPGQANYAAANAYLDGLCRHRRSLGLPGSSMNVGMITSIGAVSVNAALQTIMERIGFDGVNEEELFAQIETAVTSDQSAVTGFRGFEAHTTITGLNLKKDDYVWARKPLLRNLYSNHNFVDTEGSSVKKSLMTLLRSAKTPEERLEVLTHGFLEKLAAVLSIDQAIIQPTRGLADYGLDSIVAVEIRKWFFKSISVELAVFDVLGSKSIHALLTKVVGMLRLEEAKMETASSSKAADREDATPADANSRSDRAIINATETMETPMSTFQKRLWFMHNVTEDGWFLNLPVLIHLRGRPDRDILECALAEVKRRNDSLRTAYYEGEEFAMQKVLDDWSVDLSTLDLSNDGDPQAALQKYVNESNHETLDIEEGESQRYCLVKLSEEEHVLVWIIHHIAVDRGSTQPFLEQLAGLYQAMRTGTPITEVPSPAARYADFSAWHGKHLQSETMKAHADFWKQKYAEPVGPSKLLPFAKVQRPEDNDFRRQIHRDMLPPWLVKRMKRVGVRTGVTPAQFLMAAFRTFIYRYTQEEDLTLLMIDGNRPHPDVNETIGFFVNIVPVRCATDNDVTFEDMLAQVRRHVLEAMEHSSVPFDAIIDTVKAERSTAFFPLGQVVVNYQMHGTMPNYSTEDFEIYNVHTEDVPTACELSLEALEDPNGLKLRLESSSTLYDSQHMERFLDNFVAFMTSVIQDHRQPISEILMCGEKELTHLKHNFFNMTTKPNIWRQQPVVAKILENARRSPNQIAIETSDGDHMTYAALAKSAFAIANNIKAGGAKVGDKVAIYGRPGVSVVTSMVGTLIARCGFVALDPNFVTERLAFMLSDSGAPIMLTTTQLEGNATEIVEKAGAGVRIVNIEKAMSTEPALKYEGCDGNDPFYMIYTSGSTGKPKGVILSQANTHQMLSTLYKDYKFTGSDRFLHNTSVCFDLSMVQIFGPLTCGARLCVAAASIRQDPEALAKYMEESRISVSYFTPTQFTSLIEHARSSLERCNNWRIAFFAGERLPVRVAKALYDLKTPAVAYNAWAPSEVVVQTTIQRVECPRGHEVDIPIGFPLDNVRHYILDANRQPLPEGLDGEISVGGAQVGQGYLKRPKANKRSFVQDPFATTSDVRRGWSRMFLTGDRGRFRRDGSIEFLGRLAGDKQIKLRGYRIDLGEVEQRIFVEAGKDPANSGLADISVVARPLDPAVDGDQEPDSVQIIAFVVTKTPIATEVDRQNFAFQLHEHGAKYLNPYMLPNGYQFLENLPTTIGGKVDRLKLLKQELHLTFPVANSAKTKNPVEVTEEIEEAADEGVVDNMIALFREVLKLPSTVEVGSDSSFFTLGGQSILMLRLQAKIKRAYKKTLTLNHMFKAATPAGMAGLVGGGSRSRAKTLDDEKGNEVDWTAETTLKNEPRWQIPRGVTSIPRSEYTDFLLTGADSFIGIHQLATLLLASPDYTVHVIGAKKVLTHKDIIKLCERWNLIDDRLTAADIEFRVNCIRGSVGQAQFGLSAAAFKRLGQTVHAIYHLGGMVSLLKTYDDLRRMNVANIFDVIELAALGRSHTEIHYLSTWSVSHLQNWNTTSKKGPREKTVTSEVAATHFTPEPSNRYGYFKCRWVAENLLESAAKRGFRVTITRSSAVTAHSTKLVPEPSEDFIRNMILLMMRAGVVPDIPNHGGTYFGADFLPVNQLTDSYHALTMSNDVAKGTKTVNGGARYYHIANPSPLEIQNLPVMSRDGTVGAERVQKVPLDKWLATISEVDDSPDSQLRWTVLKEYFALGYTMFPLERTVTKKMLSLVGWEDEDVQPVDEGFLRDMMTRDQRR